MQSSSSSRLAQVTLLSLMCASAVRAQDRAAPPMPGFSTAGAALQRALEADAIARPSASSARAHSRELSKETHVGGSPAQAHTRDYVIEQMRAIDDQVRRR